MISFKTKLRSADNTGAQILQCIKIYGGFWRKTASLGDLILVRSKKLKDQKKLEKKKMYFGLIVARKKKTYRKDGSFIRFDYNKVLLFNDQNKFLGTRVYGPLCREIRGGRNEVKYKQIISFSGGSI